MTRRPAQVTMIDARSHKPRQSCAECAHASRQIEQAQPGYICRRDPPQVVAVAVPGPQGMAVQASTLWPSVRETDSCAEVFPQPASVLSN